MQCSGRASDKGSRVRIPLVEKFLLTVLPFLLDASTEINNDVDDEHGTQEEYERKQNLTLADKEASEVISLSKEGNFRILSE